MATLAPLATTGAGSGVTPAYQDESATVMLPKIAGATLVSGQAVYEDPTTGKVLVCDPSLFGSVPAASTPSGIVVFDGKRAGQSVTVLSMGVVGGFDLSAFAVGTIVYVDTAGALATVANGTKTVPIGRVVTTAVTDSSGNLRKALMIFVNPLTVIS